MSIIIVILSVIFVLGIAINIHEFGHFAVAKLLGIRVEAYSFFGLGKMIWYKEIGNTKYGISPIPIGAYVKLYGDEATSSLEGGSSEENVEAFLEERNIGKIDEEKHAKFVVPDSELYELRPRWQKFLVMVGGPFMNIMLALAIPFAGGLIYGVPSQPSPVVNSVKPGGAAEVAGIKVGDRIVGFDGVENPSWDRIRNDSLIAPEMNIPLTVERNGQRSNLTIKPTREEVKGNSVGSLDFAPAEPVILAPQPDSPASQAGLQRGDKAISINGETVGSVDNFKELIQKHKENPINLVVVRNNETKQITLQAKIGEDGKALIGTGLSNQSLDREKASISQAAAFAVNTNLEIIRLTGRVFGQLFAGERSVKDAGVAGPIGIVQQKQIEFVHPAAGQFLFRGHAQVVGELVRRAERGIGEARKAFRSVPFAGIKIVTHRADQAVGVAAHAGQGAAQHLVGLPVAVHIGGQERADALIVGVADDFEKAVVVERFAKVHEASAAPGAIGGVGQFHKIFFKLDAPAAGGRRARSRIKLKEAVRWQ